MDRLSIDFINENGHDRPSPFNTISKVNSKIAKRKSEKSLKGPAALKFNGNEIEQQLMNQIETASKIIEQFRDQISQQNQKHPKNSIQSLRVMEDVIRSKDQLIQEIQEEIKLLKNGSYGHTTDYKDKNKEENNTFRLANEIKHQREELRKHQSKFMEKQNHFNQKKQILENIEKKYKEKCKKEGLKEISFEDFKQLYRKKKKEQLQAQKNKRSQKYTQSIKEIVKEKHYENYQTDSKKMKELLAKKNVAETALKTAKKKHQLEVNDLMGKLQFLRDENTDLEEKLQLKEKQLKTAEGKFSQSRTSSDKKILSRRFRAEERF